MPFIKWICCSRTLMPSKTEPKNQDNEMKNASEKIDKQSEDESSESEYKDVVIIGNGPSGIALSYILDGNIPYYNQLPHPDEMLTARLQYVSPTEPLLEQDLSYLAAGLEGRSTNPISLLLDALEHPNADLGINHPSLLKWQKQNKKIDHIVLGKGPPGGSWHAMDPHILTLSLGSWMALPGLPYPAESNRRTSAGHVAHYYTSYVKHQNLERYFHTGTIVTEIKIVNKCKRKKKIKNDVNSNMVRKLDCSCLEESKRPTKRCRLICCKCCDQEMVKKVKSCTCVLDDYQIYDDGEEFDFVAQAKPGLNTINGHKSKSKSTVCSILDRSQSFTCDKRNYLSCSKFCYNNYNNNNNIPQNRCTCDYKYQVTGYDYHSRQPFTYYTKNVVLATGSNDQPNRLGIQGEDEHPEFIKHNLRDLEEAFLNKTTQNHPVLVVGAGLSAADAVIVARSQGLSVLHVFRKKNSSLGKQLPENMYPEYHKVHKMMSDTKSQYPLYTALPEHNLIAFDPVEQTCTLENTKTKILQTYKVSYIAILIGSRPNLNFLPARLFNLGVNKKLPIDCKLNPLDINPLTHQIANYDHLYALGPLAGDNFVRFIPGGALAIASDLFKKNIP